MPKAVKKNKKAPKPRKPRKSQKKDPLDIQRWALRTIINDRLKELGKSRYWLVRRAKSNEAVVYRFLSGEAETNSNTIRKMLRAVGLRLSVDPKFRADPPPLRKRLKKAA